MWNHLFWAFSCKGVLLQIEPAASHLLLTTRYSECITPPPAFPTN